MTDEPIENAEEAKAEIDRLGSDEGFRNDLLKGYGTVQRDAQARWDNLHETAYGDQDQPPHEPDINEVYGSVIIQDTDGMDFDNINATQSAIRQTASDIGLDSGQARDIVEIVERSIIKNGGGHADDPQDVADQTEALLREAWGDDFDDKFNKAMARINKAGDNKQFVINSLLAAGPATYAWAMQSLLFSEE